MAQYELDENGKEVLIVKDTKPNLGKRKGPITAEELEVIEKKEKQKIVKPKKPAEKIEVSQEQKSSSRNSTKKS